MLDARTDTAVAYDAELPVAADSRAGADNVEPQAYYLVDCISDADSFEAFRRPLQDLAEKSLEPAVGAGFAWTRSALCHLSMAQQGGRVLLVWRHCANDHEDALKLVGAFTVSLTPGLPGLPLHQASTWSHLFSFSGVPLVHRDHHEKALQTYLEWVFARRPATAGLFMERVPASGPFARALAQALTAGGYAVRHLEPHQRAVLTVPDDVEAYLSDAIAKKKRKEFRRLRARLAEQGELRLESFEAGDDLSGWLRDFYALEARGWKGAAGTSLASDPAWTGFFDDAFSLFRDSGDALIWKLTLDGTHIAMILAAVSGRRAWLFKIAYDEDYARSSPGVLIVLDVMAALSQSGSVDFVDSCAQADHPMINHLWRERLDLHHVLIGPADGTGLAFNSLYWLTRAKRDGREAAKRLYKTWLKGGSK